MCNEDEELKNNVIKELRPLCNNAGRAMSRNMLQNMQYKGKKQLIHNIEACGGFTEIAKAMGYKSIGKCLICLKGHLVKSEWELLLANFLFINEIHYEYEGMIESKKKTNFKTDFKVLDLTNKIKYVEIWGLSCKQSNANYRVLSEYSINRAKKTEMYKNNDLELISIEQEIFINSNYEKIYNSFINICTENNIKLNNFKPYIQDNFIKGARIDLSYIGEMLKILFDIHGRFTNSAEIRENKMAFLERYINKLGGMFKVAEYFKFDTSGIRKNWSEEEIENEFWKFVHGIGHIPSEGEYITNGRKQFLGIFKAKRNKKIKQRLYKEAKQLGYKTYLQYNGLHEPNTFDKGGKYLIKELLPICKIFKYIPSGNELKKMGRGDLVKPIQRYEGGKNHLSHVIGYPTYNEYNKRRNCTPWTLERLIREVTPLCVMLGHIPVRKELEDRKLYYLEVQIEKYGRKELSEILKFPVAKEMKGYKRLNGELNEKGIILLEELLTICNSLGYVPSKGYLKSINRRDFIGLITSIGGWSVFSNKYKLQTHLEYFKKQNTFIMMTKHYGHNKKMLQLNFFKKPF